MAAHAAHNQHVGSSFFSNPTHKTTTTPRGQWPQSGHPEILGVGKILQATHQTLLSPSQSLMASAAKYGESLGR